MAIVDIDGTDFFYTDDGDGDCFVLIHGLSCTSDDWVWQYAALRNRYRVVALDLRGHGKSTATTAGYKPQELAADVAALMERIGVTSAAVMGHSLGGAVASALAVERPELVSALITIDPAYGVPRVQVAGLNAVARALQAEAGRDALLALIDNVEGHDTPAFLRELHRRSVLRTPVEVLRQSLTGLYGLPERFGEAETAVDYLRRRGCPVLAVYVDPDRAAWDATTFQVSTSRAESFPDSGHWLHQESPARFNQLLLDWLDTIPAPVTT